MNTFSSLSFQAIKSSVNDTVRSGTNTLTTHITSIAQTGISLTKNDKETCDICAAQLSKAQITLNLLLYQACTLCNKKCCKQCIHKFTEILPDSVQEVLERKTLEWVCVKCDQMINILYMKEFQKEFCLKLDEKINLYYNINNETFNIHTLTPIPYEQNDTNYRKMIRFLQLIEVVIDYSGYSRIKYAYKAVKYAFMGK